MKKMFFAIALCIIVNSVSAQFTIGPKVGLNLSNEYSGIKPIDESNNYKTGLNAGIFGKYEINDIFDIQAELLYSQQGFKSDIKLFDYGGTILEDDFKILSQYLNIPVVLKYYPFKRFYIEAGPQIGICFNSKISPGDIDIKEAFDTNYNTVFSLVGGIGVNIGYGLSVNARYNHGFTKTYSESDFKSRVIQFSLTYDLWSF